MLRYFRGRLGPAARQRRRLPSTRGAAASAPGRRSRGLEMAENVLEEEKIENGSIVLVSDLDTAPSDESVLSSTVANIESKGIELRVVPLLANGGDLTERIVGKKNITPPQLAAQNRARSPTRRCSARTCRRSHCSAGSCSFLLAVNEWWGARVEVPRRPA